MSDNKPRRVKSVLNKQIMPFKDKANPQNPTKPMPSGT